MAAFEVGGVYRDPDSIAQCNRGRISCPGLDLGPPTGPNWQRVGRKGSFPPDCTLIAVKLHSDCCSGRFVRRQGGVLASAWPLPACVADNRREDLR